MSLIELILIVIACLFQSYVMIKITADILEDNKRFKLMVFLFALIVTTKSILVNYHQLDLGFSILLVTLSFLIIVIMNYKKPLTIKILSYSIVYLINILAEIAVMLILLILSIKYNENNYWQVMGISGMISSLQLIIYYPLQKTLKKVIKKIVSIFYYLSANYHILIISIVLVFLSIIYIFFPFKENNYVTLIIAYVIVVSATSTLIIVTYKKLLENANLNDNIKQLNNYNTAFEKVLKKQRELTHEYNNDLLMIRENLKLKKTNDAIKTIDNILKNNVNNNFDKLSKAYHTLNKSIFKQVLMYKIIELDNLKIDYIINIIGKTSVENFSSKSINNYCRCLAIIFDNVIEASKLVKKPVLIDIKQSEKLIELEISNTIPVVKNIKDDKIIHGVGLNILNKIIRQNRNIIYAQEVLNKLYIQKLTIKSK